MNFCISTCRCSLVPVQVVDWQWPKWSIYPTLSPLLSLKVGSDKIRRNGSVFIWYHTMAVGATITLWYWHQSVSGKILSTLRSKNILWASKEIKIRYLKYKILKLLWWFWVSNKIILKPFDCEIIFMGWSVTNQCSRSQCSPTSFVSLHCLLFS